MAVNRRDKEDMERWHRMQGETTVPKNKGGAPPGTQNRLTHGIFANKCLDPDEKIIFDHLIEQLRKELSGFTAAPEVAHVGTILEVGDGIAKIFGTIFENAELQLAKIYFDTMLTRSGNLRLISGIRA